MKTPATLLALLCPVICLFCPAIVNAQSPRMQLFEYFDNTSIPPNIGAFAKAHYDSLAAANAGKLITLRYQVAWGSQTGTDPMNLHNPAQVQTRVTYYTVTGDPHGIQDGGDSTLGVFRGQPALFAQHFVDTRDSATSPFTVVVSHSLNAAHDTIHCHAVITKTGTASGALKAHVAVIEETIRFLQAPGISGETYFPNVMKRMLPTDQGTTLPAMNIGDSLVLDLKWKIANVYDTTQLAVVCFVQSNTTKEVYQAGYSAPHPQANDAAVTVINSVPDFSCDSVFPEIILKNAGNAVLASCAIHYQIDGGTAASVPWTGSLAPGASTNVSLPALYLPGYHLLKVFPVNPNGSPDLVRFNDTTLTGFSNASLFSADSIAEEFESASFPLNWGVGNPEDNDTWHHAGFGGFGNSGKSISLNWYDLPAGEADDLYAPTLDLSDADSVHLKFDVAYARYDASSPDTLEVRVSADCGISWQTFYSKTSTGLATAPDTTEAFLPTAAQWKTETVDLSAFAGEPEALVQFHGISGYGNNIYLDNISIRTAKTGTGIGVSAVKNIDIFPNPFTAELNFRTSGNEPLEIILYDVASKKVVQQVFTAAVSINTANLSGGTYFYEVRNRIGTVAKGKVVKQ